MLPPLSKPYNHGHKHTGIFVHTNTHKASDFSQNP